MTAAGAVKQIDKIISASYENKKLGTLEERQALRTNLRELRKGLAEQADADKTNRLHRELFAALARMS